MFSAVHGFDKSEYQVKEGESVEIGFMRNVKGMSQFPRLSLAGTIKSHGDTSGNVFKFLLYFI